MLDTLIAIALAQNCDPAYPSDVAGNPICLPPPPPDIDCKDLEEAGFTLPVIANPPDPHGLDRDGDGLGCEAGTGYE